MPSSIKRLIQRLRRKTAGSTKAAQEGSGPQASAQDQRPASAAGPPEWETVLTESLRRSCVAPSAEAILHAYDLSNRDRYAPFHARRQEMANLYSRIMAGFSELQTLAPDAIERSMARDPWEFAHIIDHQKEPEE